MDNKCRCKKDVSPVKGRRSPYTQRLKKTLRGSKQLKSLAWKRHHVTPLAGLVLVACGSDTGDSDDSSTPTSVVTPTPIILTGAVVKGPLQGALVYADADGDGVQGLNEVGITTDSNGGYIITSLNAGATIIATTTNRRRGSGARTTRPQIWKACTARCCASSACSASASRSSRAPRERRCV